MSFGNAVEEYYSTAYKLKPDHQRKWSNPGTRLQRYVKEWLVARENEPKPKGKGRKKS